MRRSSWIFLTALVLLVSAETAQADFIYQFTTTISAGIGGSLSVTITAPNSAVATGTVSSGNIASLSLELSGASSPFVDGSTTSTAALSTPFSVNPTTGVFTSGSPELFAAFAPETVTLASASSLTASYKVSMPDVVNEGTGVWTVTPEPSSGVLVGVGTIVAWGLGFRRRA